MVDQIVVVGFWKGGEVRGTKFEVRKEAVLLVFVRTRRIRNLTPACLGGTCVPVRWVGVGCLAVWETSAPLGSMMSLHHNDLGALGRLGFLSPRSISPSTMPHSRVIHNNR